MSNIKIKHDEGGQRALAASFRREAMELCSEKEAWIFERAKLVKQRDDLMNAIGQFLDPDGNPPEDTGEWREVLRVIGNVKSDSCCEDGDEPEWQNAVQAAAGGLTQTALEG